MPPYFKKFSTVVLLIVRSRLLHTAKYNLDANRAAKTYFLEFEMIHKPRRFGSDDLILTIEEIFIILKKSSL